MSKVITLYVADVNMNKMMKCVDLRPDYKWYVKYVTSKIKVDDTTIDKLKKRMRDSKENKDFYVPVIELDGAFIVDEGVKEISDGIKTFCL